MIIVFDNNPDIAADEIYTLAKNAYKNGVFKSSHIEALADLFTELANRLKEEEACGE